MGRYAMDYSGEHELHSKLERSKGEAYLGVIRTLICVLRKCILVELEQGIAISY